RLDPIGPLLGNALLVDRLALGTVRVALQLRGPLVERADDSLADREVVLDEAELRLSPRGEEHLVRVGHLDEALAHLELDERRRHPGKYPGCVLENSQRVDLNLEPLDDFLVVQPTDLETETRSGLILPAGIQERGSR